MAELTIALIVGVGGALGALCRWGIDLACEGLGFDRPVATVSINILGCFLMGLLVAAVLTHPRAHPHLRPLLGAGFLGGFTTFSAFAGELVAFWKDGQFLVGAGYLTLSIVGSLGAVWLGVRVGSRVPWRAS